MDSDAWSVHAIWSLGGERLETYRRREECQEQPEEAKLASGNEFAVASAQSTMSETLVRAAQHEESRPLVVVPGRS
jgi:hypothetical protein